MSEIDVILIRTVTIYFVLTVSMRIMGKRQLGELQISELITTLLLSEIAAVPITDFTIPLTRSLIPIVLIISFEIIIPYLGSHFKKLGDVIDGKPAYIIFEGKPDQREIRKNRISLRELISELRTQGYFDLSEIRYAILEPNGSISVFPKAESRPATCSESSITPNDSGIAHSVIANGKIIDFNLNLLSLDRAWLSAELSRNGASVKDVYLMTVDDTKNVKIIFRDGSVPAEKKTETG